MDLLSYLTESLGVTRDQARGGAGLIMRLAKERLEAGEFSQIAQSVPNIEGLIKAAPKVSGTAKALDDLSRPQVSGASNVQNLASLTAGFNKLGLDTSVVERFVPVVLSYVESQGGNTTRTILEKLLLK